MINLRKINKEDRPLFAKWWRDEDLIKLTSGILEPISEKEVNEFLGDMLDGDDYHFIIEQDRKPIGHIALVNGENDWYQTQIILDKEFWGQGFGPEAIKQIIKFPHSLNINKIYLEVRLENIRAIKAYEKCGFKSVATLQYPENPTQPVTIRMELRLNCN